jgi:hypothetical protein
MAFAFLIIGAGRSGTSLLASLVDAHPRLRCGMEVASVHCLSGEKARNPSSASDRLRCLEDACIKHANASSFNWGNKLTTEQIAFLDALTPAELAFFSHFHAQKIIYVLRDGRGCVQSKMNRKGKSLEAAIASWRRSLRMLDWLHVHAPERTLVVRFEELLSRPVEVLANVAQFLGDVYDPLMLTGTDNPIMPEIYRGMDGIQPEKAETPTPQAWHGLIEEDLKRYGY